jgi:hypothetical protein
MSIEGITSLGTRVTSVRGVDNLGSIRATNFVNLFNQETEFLPRNFKTLVINFDFPTSATSATFGNT